MQRILETVRGSDFLRHNAILFIGSAAMSVLNYLYYPVLGRLLAPSEFGEVQTIVSLFLQIAIFLGVLALLTVNITANADDKPESQRVIFELEKLALIVSVAGLALVAVLGPLLRNFFQFDSVLPFILLSLAIVVSVPGTFRTAYLRGKQRFGQNSWAGLIGAGSKLVFSAVFIVLGLGVSGAIVGLVLAQLFSFLYAARKARQAGFSPSLSGSWRQLPDLKLVKPELPYAFLVLCGSLAITALYSIDIVAVKHYFDAHTAGLYAGIATVARIIFFLTGSISQVLLPAVKLNNPPGRNRQVLRNSAILLVGLGGVALLVFWFLPELVVRLLMGSGYTELANLLPRLSLTIFLVSILNLFVQYYLALRRPMIGVISLLGLVVTGGLVVINHATPMAVVNSMLLGTLVSLVLLAIWVAASAGGLMAKASRALPLPPAGKLAGGQ